MTRPLQILIVDDHELLAVGLEQYLAELGHTVVDIVATGEDAIAAAERHRPDLIFMDVTLEGAEIDGIDAAREIWDRVGLRSVFYTGHTDQGTRERAAAAEPLAFLDKTCPTSALAQVMETVSRGSALA
jgi:two-component system, response regulator PdtaR